MDPSITNMQVTVKYSHHQVTGAIKYISEYNKAWKGNQDYITNSIFRSFRELAETFYYGNRAISTLGYRVRAYAIQKEGIDHDINVLRMDVTVDPRLSMEERMNDDETDIEYTVSIDSKRV